MNQPGKDKTSNIVTINLPDDESEAVDLILSHKNCPRVKIAGKLKKWYQVLIGWIEENSIVYLDLYDLTEMTTWEFSFNGIYLCGLLEEVRLPKNLKRIGPYIFDGCDSLHTVHIPSALEYIGSADLPPFPDSKLKKIYLELSKTNRWVIPDYSNIEVEYTITDKNFADIDGALYDMDRKELMKVSEDYKGEYIFPEYIEYVENYAFRNTRFDKLVIPGNIKEIGWGVFHGASIETLILEEGIEKLSHDSLFSNSNIKNIVLPDSLKEIGFMQFNGDNNFENIGFRDNNPRFEFENYILYDKLAQSAIGFVPYQANEYVVRNGTKTIGKMAFSQGAFKDRRKISIYLPESIEAIEEQAFYNCNIDEIYLSGNLKYIGKDAFLWSGLKKVFIPDSVEIIERGAFCGCISLIEVRLPSELKDLKYATFLYCQSLESIDVPDNVSIIEKHCFKDCINLKTIILPEQLIQIKEWAFQGCKSVKKLTFPDSLEQIYDGAFYECISLEEIMLGEGLIELGSRAFHGCAMLKKINIPSKCRLSPASYGFESEGRDSIYDVSVASDNPYYTLTDGILYNKKRDLLIKSFSSEKVIEIPSGVETIGYMAFANTPCEVVFIPDSVTKIERQVFRNCKNLEHVRFSRNIKEFEIWAQLFDNCVNLKKITNLDPKIREQFPDVFKGLTCLFETSDTEPSNEK